MVMGGKMCLDGSEEFSQIEKSGLSMEKRCPRILFLSLADKKHSEGKMKQSEVY